MACQKVYNQGRDDIIVKVNLQTGPAEAKMNWSGVTGNPIRAKILFVDW